MPRLIGSDFLTLQGADLEAGRDFYTRVVGLQPAAPPRGRGLRHKAGTFARHFAFRHPFGCAITAHALAGAG